MFEIFFKRWKATKSFFDQDGVAYTQSNAGSAIGARNLLDYADFNPREAANIRTSLFNVVTRCRLLSFLTSRQEQNSGHVQKNWLK
jgi:hypothetical protein